MATLAGFIQQMGITQEVEWAAENPNMSDKNWPAKHYTITLSRPNGATMTVPFSMGMGHIGEPKITQVVDAIAMDSSTVDNHVNFEDWAQDLGFDPDSRKAEKTYLACKETARQLKEFLGEDAYHDLLWEIDRM